MIHLVVREPVPYQITLCRELEKGYSGQFVAWFLRGPSEELPYTQSSDVHFQKHYLDQEGYIALARHLWSDPAAVIILGGWSGRMTLPTLILATILRQPVFIWLDHPHPKRRSALFKFLRKIYLQMLDKGVAGFLACGKPTVEHLAAIGLRNRNIICFPYWVEIPSQWEMPESIRNIGPKPPLRLLAVGRHVPVKHFDTAIEALARANEYGGTKTAELVLVGDGPERQNLESLSRSLGCSESVRFAGWLNSQQVYSEIKNSDVLVLPSSFEGYGVTVLEAMSAGRMVLASEGVTAAHDRNDGRGAILIHPVGDSEYLAMQIHELANDRQRLAHGSSAARRVSEDWPVERAVLILDKVLLETKRGRMLSERLADRTQTRVVRAER